MLVQAALAAHLACRQKKSVSPPALTYTAVKDQSNRYVLVTQFAPLPHNGLSADAMCTALLYTTTTPCPDGGLRSATDCRPSSPHINITDAQVDVPPN